MIHFLLESSDDQRFVNLAECASNGAAAVVGAEFLHIVKIDSWFGDRWFKFSGKYLGAAGVRGLDFIVPPFHPHRVISETRYRVRDTSEPIPFDEPPHPHRSSHSNLNNSIMRIGNSITVGWYSGDSSSNGRGSIMVYSVAAHGAVGWYAGLGRGGEEWKLGKTVGIDPREWAMMLEASSTTS